MNKGKVSGIRTMDNGQKMDYLKKEKMNFQKLVSTLEAEQCKKSIPHIQVGDEVKVNLVIQEGNKERVQPSQGTVIAFHPSGLKSTVTVRRVFQGIGFERVLPIHSPVLQSIEIIRHTKIRRAKLYFLRNRIGKGTRLVTKLKS